MSDKAAPTEPRRTAEEGQRADRLAAALRANLARRKAQTRARDAAGQDDNEQG